ncbi:MAG: hypothetical protein PUE04_06815 [Lachnospira sp.]|nr:hypothetical protein [Lachnospira sp.]
MEREKRRAERRTPGRRNLSRRFSPNRMVAVFVAAVITAVVIVAGAYPVMARAGRVSAAKSQIREAAGEQELYDSVSVIRMKQAVEADDYSAMTGMRSAADILIDADACKIIAAAGTAATGSTPLYQTRIRPASMTKVLTLVTIVENLPADWKSRTYTFNVDKLQYLVTGLNASLAGFLSGETASAEDLMYGAILPSGADAVEGLVETFFPSEEDFMAKMNETAQKIGMTNSHFTNPYGLDDPDLYSTPEDIARLLQYAMHNSTCEEILTARTYTTQVMSRHSEGLSFTSGAYAAMSGTDGMPGDVTYIGGKTGYTESGYSIVVMYLKNGHHYICVAANAKTDQDRNADVRDMLMNYAK